MQSIYVTFSPNGEYHSCVGRNPRSFCRLIGLRKTNSHSRSLKTRDLGCHYDLQRSIILLGGHSHERWNPVVFPGFLLTQEGQRYPLTRRGLWPRRHVPPGERRVLPAAKMLPSSFDCLHPGRLLQLVGGKNRHEPPQIVVITTGGYSQPTPREIAFTYKQLHITY